MKIQIQCPGTFASGMCDSFGAIVCPACGQVLRAISAGVPPHTTFEEVKSPQEPKP